MITCGAALLLVASAASAYDPCGHLYTVCESGAMHVHFYVGAASYHPEIVGYDLYRNVWGTCLPETRLTDVPWPRVSTDTEFQLVDPVVTPGRKNVYRVVGVDAARNQIDLHGLCPDNWNAHINYVGCGPAPAAHGTIWSGYNLWIESCDPCYPGTWFAWSSLTSLLPYIDSGTPLLFYGSQGCQGYEGCFMTIDSFVEQPCVISVQPTTWSNVKTLYH
jgi:hypothetical protein